MAKKWTDHGMQLLSTTPIGLRPIQPLAKVQSNPDAATVQ